MLIVTHEQWGAQPYLEILDVGAIPSEVESWFLNVEMGADRTFHTRTDIGDDQGIDLDSPVSDPRFGDNKIWNLNMLSLDPNGQNTSVIFDAAGFNVQVGTTASNSAVDVDALTGPGAPTPPAWIGWKTGGTDGCTTSPYCGNKAQSWPNWNERMWYLVNLFRVLNNDDRLRRQPEGSELSDPRFDVYAVGVRERLAI